MVEQRGVNGQDEQRIHHLACDLGGTGDRRQTQVGLPRGAIVYPQQGRDDEVGRQDQGMGEE